MKENKILEQITEELHGFIALGYRPKKIILLPNPVTKEMSSIYGMEIEHRKLYTSDGELIPISFEE